jgi:WD40 repeat protein
MFYSYRGSISKVRSDGQNVAISASYDRTLRVWDCSSSVARGVVLFAEHRQPVTAFDWRNSLVVSGDRSGHLCTWDINTGKSVREIGGHTKQVATIMVSSSPATFLLSAG